MIEALRKQFSVEQELGHSIGLRRPQRPWHIGTFPSTSKCKTGLQILRRQETPVVGTPRRVAILRGLP